MSARPTTIRSNVLLPLLVFGLLAANLGGILAFKLPTFLSSWRPTTQSPMSSIDSNSNNLQQDPLMTSASVFEPDTRPPGGKFAALTRTHSHHHHLPLHLFRSLPKSIFGRLLPSATTPSTTTATAATDPPAPMFVDWSAISSGNNNDGPIPFMMNHHHHEQQQQQQQPQMHQQPHQHHRPAYSNAYHFQATQPMQVNHFSVDHSQMRPEKHALGYGESGEEFATIMSVEPQPQQENRQTTESPRTMNETDLGQPDQQQQQQQQGDREQPRQPAPPSSQSSNNSSAELSQQLGDEFKQQSNATANATSSSALLTNLIGEELTRLKQEPEELNSTLASMGQPLLALLLEQQQQQQQATESKDNSSLDATATATVATMASVTAGEPSQQQSMDSGANSPESGRSESAASAVVVVPPSSGFGASEDDASSGSNLDDGSENNNHEFAIVNDESNAIAAAAAFEEQQQPAQQMDSGFILGPYKGLTSDSIVHHHHHHHPSAQQQQQQQQLEYRQKPSVGMSAMASNLIQQAKSLIQMPFTTSTNNNNNNNNNGLGSSMVHTMLNGNSNNNQQQQQQPNRESRITSLFRGQSPNYLRQPPPPQELLIEQATSPAPFSFTPALTTNNNYHQRPQRPFHHQRQQQQQQRPPAWQQSPPLNFPSMMMPNHANNQPLMQQQSLQQQQQRSRPTNPFGFNRYFLMPSTTSPALASTTHMGHLHQQQPQPQHPLGQQQQQQSGAKNVPYFVERPHPMNHVQEQRPQVSERGNSQATGFQIAIDHKSNQPRESSSSLEQARKKFKSGFYQIEPPRLAPGRSEPPQQQLKLTGDEEQLQQIKEEQESIQQDNEQQTEENDDGEQLQQASSGGSSTERPQQQPVTEFAAKQVGASIGFLAAPTINSTATAKTHMGKVFNEPISDLMPRDKVTKVDKTSAAAEDGGQSLSQTKQLKHTEEVTLYEFESPARTRDAPQSKPPVVQQQQQQQQQQLLDTQVFTVPYTITMQPNGQTPPFVASTAQRMPPHGNNFVHHREPPFAHSFISSTWAAPSQAQRFFQTQNPASVRLPQLQYMAPPGAETVRQQTQQQLFKSVFEEAQQMSNKPQLGWGQTPMRPVSALAIAPVYQQQNQQHYFHYQPLQVQPQQQQPHRMPQQQQQVVFELADQPRQAAQQQQFAMAIDHSSDQSVGGSVFTGNQQTVEQPTGKSAESTTTTAPSSPPSTSSTTESSPTTATPTIEVTASPVQSREQREGRAEVTDFPPVRENEDDDDERTERLASLRSFSSTNRRAEEQQSAGQPGSPSAFCAKRAPGLYADESQKCKAYYQCAPSGHQMFRCNNQTQFNQKTQNCDWWYNVNCGGQGLSSDSEQLPQGEPLQRQSGSSGEDDGTSAGADRGTNNKPQSSSALSGLSLEQDSRLQQQVAQQQQATLLTSTGPGTEERFHHADSASTIAPSAMDQQSGSSTQQQQQQQQQQPAPTSSTPIYGGQQSAEFMTNQEQQQSSSGNSQREFSARSTTTQDPLLLQPTTTTITTSTFTGASTEQPTTEQISAAATAAAISDQQQQQQQQEAQPQVGSQLNDSPNEHSGEVVVSSISSSTSISSDIGADVTSAAPTSDTRSAPKLLVRSISGRISSGPDSPPSRSTAATSSGQQQHHQQQEDSSIYSTSANQGSVSYTPMNTHQLTAQAFHQQQQQQQPGDGEVAAEAPKSKPRPVEKRFGARLQSLNQQTTTTATTTTTTMPTTNHRRQKEIST